MRLTMLGHASVLVEANGRTILIDPVFGDTFAEGALAPCPSRVVDASQLPRIDFVVITHGEIDHFDLATLASLPRESKVICPRDQHVLYALDRLGFVSVRPTEPNTILKLGKFEMMATPSVRDPNEFGVIVQDDTGTLWHQSDTIPSPDAIERVRAAFGRVDLLLAPYAVRSFAYFGSRRAGYPTAHLQGAVACARQIAPVLVVPASAGFRYVEPLAWANAFVFPVSRARYLAELARVAPDRASAIGNPGDVFDIRKGAVTRNAQASRIARMIDDDTHRIAFDPTAHVPPMSDPNLDAYPPNVLDREVSVTFEGLAEFVREGYRSSDQLVHEHRRTRSIYGLGVVFPDGRERWWRCHFEPDEPRFAHGEGRIRGALITHRLPASLLAARARSERRYDFAGGLSRLCMISAASMVDGKVVLEATEPPDLLFYFLSTRPPGFEQHTKRHIDFRSAPLLGAPARAS